MRWRAHLRGVCVDRRVERLPNRECTPMNKLIKVLACVGVAVAGWQALRYFYGRPSVSADLAAEQSFARRTAYRRATERWENEGGATLAGRPGIPSHSK